MLYIGLQQPTPLLSLSFPFCSTLSIQGPGRSPQASIFDDDSSWGHVLPHLSLPPGWHTSGTRTCPPSLGVAGASKQAITPSSRRRMDERRTPALQASRRFLLVRCPYASGLRLEIHTQIVSDLSQMVRSIKSVKFLRQNILSSGSCF